MMSKEEIIKGLECCQTQYNRKCGECPYKKYMAAAISVETCDSRLKADLLKLIREEGLK
jgi:hypothetical protein